LLLTVAGVVFVISYTFNIPILGGTVLMFTQYLGLILALFLPLSFLLFPATKGASRTKVPWYDILLAALSTGLPILVLISGNQPKAEGWEMYAPPYAFILALLMLGMLIEAVRRSTGSIFAAIAGFFCTMPLFCQFFPGFLTGRGYSLQRTISFHGYGPESIFGMPTSILGTVLVPLLIFAEVMMWGGGGKFLINLALCLVGGLRGGAAKVAVVSSAFFASISGSPLANVATTGMVTIPLMKKGGYSPVYAGAIECAASNAGVLTPPVMGATAFIMAEFLGITYVEVALAAAIPAFLYYVALFLQTDLYAVKNKLKAVERADLPSLGKTLKEGWFMLLGLGVFIYFIFFLRYSPGVSCLYAVIALILLSYVRKETRLGPRGFLRIAEGLGRLFAELTPVLVAAGLIIGSLSITGIGVAISSQVAVLGGENFALMLILASGAAFVMGMGVTLLAIYVLLAIVLAPGMVEAGVVPIAGHLFCCYWAMLSFMTPPVALSAFAAASLAEANYWDVGWRAVRLGIVGYLVPFMFVYRPALVLQGGPLDVLLGLCMALVGVACLSAAIEGYFYGMKRIDWPRRLLFIGVAVLLFLPEMYLNFIGLGVALAVYLERIVEQRLGVRTSGS